MKAPSGTAMSTLTVESSGAVIDVTWMVGLQVHGDLRSRFQLNTTAWALSGVPSENFTPLRQVMVTVLPPLENL